MGLAENIKDLTLVIFELITLFIAVDGVFLKKNQSRLFQAVITSFFFFIFVAVVYVFANLLPSDSTMLYFKVPIIFILITVFIHLLYVGKIVIQFIFSLLFIVFISLLDYFILLIVEKNITLYNSVYTKSDRIFMILLISKVIAFILVVLFVKNKKTFSYMDSKGLFKFAVVPFITLFSIIWQLKLGDTSIIPQRLLIPIVFIVINIVVYFMMKEVIEISEQNRIKSVNEEKMSAQLNLYKKIRENDKEQRKLMHDYTNTLLCIEGLIEDGKIEDCRKYLQGTVAKYKHNVGFIKTGNSLIDALIKIKYNEAVSKGITLVLNMCNLKDSGIEEDDLFVIMSNLLDNAIECVSNLEYRDKVIEFKIKNNSENFALSITNPIEEPLEVRDNLIRTSKKNKKNHGLGLVNVKEHVAKYNGRIIIKTDKNRFVYFIMITK